VKFNYILPKSVANGPGTRYTLWLQGCSIQCPGCSNVDTWDPLGGQAVSIAEILLHIEDMEEILHGVRITGGEPLDQFVEVYDLCDIISKYYDRLSIFLTTGYTLDQIVDKDYKHILDVIDILCTGPFEKDKICKGEWKGSSNQKLFFLTDLGKKQSMMPKIFKEIFISSKGDSLETGFTS